MTNRFENHPSYAEIRQIHDDIIKARRRKRRADLVLSCILGTIIALIIAGMALGAACVWP